MTALPNVFPELSQGTYAGSALVIRNTFIDVEPSVEDAQNLNSKRSHSLSPIRGPYPDSRHFTFLDSPSRRLRSPEGPAFHVSRCDAAADEDDQKNSPRSCFTGLSTCTPGSSVRFSPGTASSASHSQFGAASSASHSQLGTSVDVRRRLLTSDGGDTIASEGTQQQGPSSCITITPKHKAYYEPSSPAFPTQITSRARLRQLQKDHITSTSTPPTTVLLKNLPEEYTREMLTETLNAQGFTARFNFVYSPMDFGTQTSFGYAFINLVFPEDADQFLTVFDDFCDWSVPSSKVAEVDWSDRQGLEGLIERYRNSPLMHDQVPDEAKPILLQNGERVEFPPPTQAIKPLKVRQSKARETKFKTRRSS